MQTFFLFLDLLLAAVGTVGLVIASLGIVNTLVMAVLERYQEIGIFKAIGASDGDIQLLFLTEAVCVGFIGSLGGLLLGWIVSGILDTIAHYYVHAQGLSTEFDLFAFPWWLILGNILFGLLVSTLAGVYPATRAARVDPIQALRGL